MVSNLFKGQPIYLDLAQRTALTAQTGSLVSPTRKVTSHNSGMEAKNLISSARPDLFSNMLVSSSGSSKPGGKITSGVAIICELKVRVLQRSRQSRCGRKLVVARKAYTQQLAMVSNIIMVEVKAMFVERATRVGPF